MILAQAQLSTMLTEGRMVSGEQIHQSEKEQRNVWENGWC